MLRLLLSQLMYRLCPVSERLCGPGSPRGMRAVSRSCHGGASKMAPDLRAVSGPGKVWRRTNSSGRRFEVPEFGAICKGHREDAIYPESLSFRSLCAERGRVWARYERCHVGSTRMLIHCYNLGQSSLDKPTKTIDIDIFCHSRTSHACE